MRALALLGLGPLLAGCWPTQPAEGALKNLRVVAMRQEPAVALLDRFPLEPVTVRALVVDPLDEELTDAEHSFALDLPEDLEGAELLAGLVPPGPHGTTVTIDFAALLGGMGARDEVDTAEFLPVPYGEGLLPLRFTTKNAERTREAVKFLSFLVPDASELPPPSSGPVGWRPRDVYDAALAELPEEPEAWNANPAITKVTVDEGRLVWDDVAGPEAGDWLDLGAIDPGAAIRFDVELADDALAADTDVDLYWTHGTPGLPEPEQEDEGAFGPGGPPEEPDDGPADDEPEAQDGEGFGGGSGNLDEPFEPERAFGWTAPTAVRQGPIRLFLVARDEEGGATWVELRATLRE